MKKYLLVTLLSIVMVLPSAGAFAQEQNSSAKRSIAGSAPADAHINAFRVDKIIGSGVINLEGERIGTIDDLVLDIDTGRIVYAALEFSGFMGFGDKLFAVPWQSLTSVPAEGILILDQSKAKLKNAPGFDKKSWPDVGDKSWGAGIYAFYRHHLPAPQPAAAPKTLREQTRMRGYGTDAGYLTEPDAYSSAWAGVYDRLFDPEKIESVTGEILKVEFNEGLKLIIYTDTKKPVLVGLGSAGHLEGQASALKQGNRVTVTGSSIIVDDTPFLIAAKIKEGNEELQLRDKQGHSIWVGWRKIN